ncbi:MAG: multicopper oxidase domain-containing protein [Terracidiphilus sp.]|jgi:FtsP/CotA-like multicopper oxidase with cupredoxin domain
MNRSLVRPFVFAAIAAGLSLPAVAQVREFEPPPTLVPAGPQATAKLNALMLAAKPSPSEACEQATVAVDGRIVNVTLKEMYADSFIFNPATDDPWPNHMDPLHLRSYGGCKQGPLIPVYPGDTLRVNLINDLPKDDPTCLPNPPAGLALPPGVGCFNTINLHTHGLHVSPSGNSDNVLLNILPQTQFPYEFNIPEDHPAGTFWYHAHRHGSTAVDVSSGAAGILVVRGNRPYTPPTKEDPHPIADIDTVLHDPAGKPLAEQFFFFQQLAYACFSNPPDQVGGPWQQLWTKNGFYNVLSPPTGKTSPANSEWTCPLPTKDNYATPGVLENFQLQLFSASIWDTNGRFTSVNGVVQPTITIPAGEIQRWRFVHAGVHDTINLQLVRAIPQVGSDTALKDSSFKGNRLEQADEVQHECPSLPETLVPQFAIASDGLTMTRIHNLEGLNVPSSDGANYLQPGYRSDILVVFPEDGYYCLLDQAAPQSQRFDPSTGNGGGSGPSKAQLLGIIHVVGGHPVTGDLEKYIEDSLYAANPQLPAPVRDGLRNGDLTPWAPFIDLAPPERREEPQQANFAINTAASGSPFQINGVSYDPNVVNITRQVNTTDDWILQATGNPVQAAEPHIFHIHVNPFEVIDVIHILPDGTQQSIYDEHGHCTKDIVPDSQGLANQYCGMWHTFRDTIFVENNYYVKIRTRYDRYIGEYVIHCHILDHEDAGMMLNIEIVPDATQPNGGLGMPGMKHLH